MALGFGFNRAKVLSSAERNVQQGKIQNAIQDYEKVAKHDPKDLTVLNTIGDLYARMGQPEQAAAHFKKVGEAYASEGFTVKAIAIYKKITKISPEHSDHFRRLAELYTLQGLHNDARQQYLILAEQHVRSGDLDSATRVFHKMLELDPENLALQTRLAELYIRAGKKDQAEEIFFRAAESLERRGAWDAADEALSRVLSLSPANVRALLMRARVALSGSNPAAAVRCLEGIPNIDSNSEGLSVLLRARLLLGQPDEAEPLSRKLFTVHNEIGGINIYAEWLASHGEFERALKLYSEHSERLLASNPEPLLKALRSMTERFKENPSALEMLLALLQKAGDEAHVTEVMELLAHALVQRQDLPRARDLYRHLSVLEPENPQHEQNYRQIVARLGEDSAVRALTPQQGGQAFMVDELEVSSPPLDQQHAVEIADAVNAALTEAELLDSYNLLPKAIATLETILPRAANDVRLNQRLASLYARSDRFAEAGRCCELLASAYSGAGRSEQSKEYASLAAKYSQRGKQAATNDSAVQFDVVVEPPAAEIPPAAAEFAVEAPVPSDLPVPEVELEAAPEAASLQPASAEIDLSDEWQSTLAPETVSAPQPSVQDPSATPQSRDFAPPQVVHAELAEAVASEPEPEIVIEEEEAEVPATLELLDEIRFYISQQMWEEAAAVAETCAKVAPGLSELGSLKQQIATGLATAKPEEPEWLDAPPPLPVTSETAPAERALHTGFAPARFDSGVEEATHSQPSAPPPPAPVKSPSHAVMASVIPAPSAAQFAANPLGDLVSGIEDSLPAEFAAAHSASVPETTVPATTSAYVEIPAAQPIRADVPDSVLSDVFAEFKQGAEQSQTQTEDPESHYNLGIAFREMGLLEEAIGELQKVALAMEKGQPFRDSLQVYTLLGQSFVEKSVPEAAIRWYEKALKHTSDQDARIAVHYELGLASQAAGMRQSALQHFLEVYGSNIDYRDVAERIRALRS